MLHWLAGQRPAEPEVNTHFEPPETPAPLFAVRAFKHAIFGTPATAYQKQRRNSNIERELTQPVFSRPARPNLPRPKSANDATTLVQFDDIPPSPTKGILLTPGTAGGRGKTVTFGDHVTNANVKRPAETSRKPANAADSIKKVKLQVEQSGSVKQSQHHDHDSIAIETSVNQEQRDKDGRCDCQGELHHESESEPTCPVAMHWKREYDIYREKTTQELKKLATKQRAAKGYARDKDSQCTVLKDELRLERKRVERLEARASLLEEQMKQMTADLDKARSLLAVAQAIEKVHEVAPEAETSQTRTYVIDGDREQNVDQGSRISGRTEGERAINETVAEIFETLGPVSRHDVGDKSLTPSATVPIAAKSNRLEQRHDITRATLSETNTFPVTKSFKDNPLATISANAVRATPACAETRAGRLSSSEDRVVTDSRSLWQKRHDSFEPEHQLDLDTVNNGLGPVEDNVISSPSFDPNAWQSPEIKENRMPTEVADNGRRITSRSGVEIPPDRIAAARARLAARRQQRAGT